MKAFPNLSNKELNELSKREVKRTKEEFEDFKTKFAIGVCYLCDDSFSVFKKEKPCIHWLLRPQGFDKEHFPLVYQNFDYHKIQPYLRWIANTEAVYKNINDLVEEKRSNKVIENTITFKNIEWSFSASKNDFAGIADSKVGDMPHYHFQMRIDNKPFINYSEFHIPFTNYDLWTFRVQNGEFEDLKHTYNYGMGMQSAIDELSPEQLLEGLSRTTDETKAAFHLSTMIEADKGYKIPGDKVNEIIKEHKKTGVPIAKLIRRIPHIKATTIITPGPGVPKIAARKGGRGKNNRNQKD